MSQAVQLVAKLLFARESANVSKETLQLSLWTLSTEVYRKFGSVNSFSPEDHDNAHMYNFDHPDALDFDLANEKINELLEGKDC